MASVRPLRELLADLVGDAGAHSGGPEAYLAEHGYPDLPADLVAEAVVSFADTASPEVAEHLAPFVTAHTAGDEDAGDWFDLLASAEAPDDPEVLDGDPDPWSVADFDSDPGPGLDFGAGAVDGIDGVDHAAALDDEAHTDWPTAVEHHAAPDITEPVEEPSSEDVIEDVEDADDDRDDDDDSDEDSLD
jgi:hypothetical protein